MSVGVQPFKPIQVLHGAGDLWRWSVDKYHALIDTGILEEDDPVELLEGYIVMKHVRSGEPWLWSVEKYHEMIEQGILLEDDPVELLEGCLVRKMPKNPNHTMSTGLVSDLLRSLILEGWFINVQDPIVIGDGEPEPDAVVIRGSRRDYITTHPGPDDIALVVEVSETSLEMDRTSKQRMYAAAGIPCYWIVNLQDMCLEVFSEPAGVDEDANYGSAVKVGRDEKVTLVIDGKVVGEIAVNDLLP
jgi:Uma2 family endonuclease